MKYPRWNFIYDSVVEMYNVIYINGEGRELATISFTDEYDNEDYVELDDKEIIAIEYLTDTSGLYNAVNYVTCNRFADITEKDLSHLYLSKNPMAQSLFYSLNNEIDYPAMLDYISLSVEDLAKLLGVESKSFHDRVGGNLEGFNIAEKLFVHHLYLHFVMDDYGHDSEINDEQGSFDISNVLEPDSALEMAHLFILKDILSKLSEEVLAKDKLVNPYEKKVIVELNQLAKSDVSFEEFAEFLMKHQGLLLNIGGLGEAFEKQGTKKRKSNIINFPKKKRKKDDS